VVAAQSSDSNDFFENRFDGKWIKNGNQALQIDGGYGGPVRYWSNIRNRAQELLGKPPIPGRDYVLSEIAHCESLSEAGVPEAIQTCAARYLGPFLRVANARLIVLLGKKAWKMCNELQDAKLPEEKKREGTNLIEIEGKLRVVVYMPHPSGGEPEPKRFTDRMSPGRLAALQGSLLSGNL